DDDLQALPGLLHVFELAAPDVIIARRQLQPVADGFFGLGDVTAHVNVPDVHIDPGGTPGVFTADHIGALVDLDVRHLVHGHLYAALGGDEDAAQGREVFPVILEIAQVDGVALQPLHRLGDILPSQGGGDDVLDVPHGEAVAGRFPAVNGEIEIITAGDPFRKGAGGLRQALENGFRVRGQAVEDLKVGAHDLKAHRGLDTGGQHVDADLDGIAPGIGQAGEFHRLIHF